MPVIIRSFHPASFFLDDPVPIMTAPPSPRAVLAQLQSYVANPPTEISNDDNLRRELYTASRKLQLQLEETPTTMLRLTIGHAAEKAVLRIAFDLGLLPYIAEEGSPKTLHDIKTHIKADEVLLLRVLRALAAAGTILEVGEDAYTLASNCRLFGDQSFIDAARDCEDIVTQVFDAMPEFLASTGYRNPTDRRNGPANKAVNQPDADLFELMRTKFPEKSSSFGHFLGSFTQDSAKPHEIYPVKDRLIHGLESEAQSYAWIDVGGGMGLYTAALQNAYPELAGRCVVQEQEMMLAVAKNRGADKRVEFMAHDFLTEQPLKGKKRSTPIIDPTTDLKRCPRILLPQHLP